MTHFPETSATAKVSDKLCWRKSQRKGENLQNHRITYLGKWLFVGTILKPAGLVHPFDFYFLLEQSLNKDCLFA